MNKLMMVVAVLLVLTVCSGQEKLSGIVSKPFNIVVNYDLTLAQAYKAGHYDLKNSMTDDSNPSRGQRKLEIFLVSFDRELSTANQAPIFLAEQGLRPVDLRELLAFGAAFPEEQTKHMIIALGASHQGPCGSDAAALYSEHDGGLVVKRVLHYISVTYFPNNCSNKSLNLSLKEDTCFAATKAR